MKWLLALCVCALPSAAVANTFEEQGVAAVLMGEAWSEGVRGMTAVAEVIRQRAAEKGLPPLRIVEARRGRVHAFSCLNGRDLAKLIEKYREEPDFQQALALAHEVCTNPAALPYTTKSANHYTRVTERPYWAKGKRPVTIIGQHAFYRLKHY